MGERMVELIRRALFAVPVLGWMLRDVERGGAASLGWFAASLAMLLALATVLFGLPGLVMGMIGATLLIFCGLLVVIRG